MKLKTDNKGIERVDENLFDGILAGDLKRCENAIKEGANLTAIKDGYTPLMLGAYLGEDDICKFLIKKGAEINFRDYYQNTALHYAAYHGRFGVCKILVEGGADTNASNQFDETPFACAASQAHHHICELLSTNGWNGNINSEASSV